MDLRPRHVPLLHKLDRRLFFRVQAHPQDLKPLGVVLLIQLFQGWQVLCGGLAPGVPEQHQQRLPLELPGVDHSPLQPRPRQGQQLAVQPQPQQRSVGPLRRVGLAVIGHHALVPAAGLFDLPREFILEAQLQRRFSRIVAAGVLLDERFQVFQPLRMHLRSRFVVLGRPHRQGVFGPCPAVLGECRQLGELDRHLRVEFLQPLDARGISPRLHPLVDHVQQLPHPLLAVVVGGCLVEQFDQDVVEILVVLLPFRLRRVRGRGLFLQVPQLVEQLPDLLGDGVGGRPGHRHGSRSANCLEHHQSAGEFDLPLGVGGGRRTGQLPGLAHLEQFTQHHQSLLPGVAVIDKRHRVLGDQQVLLALVRVGRDEPRARRIKPPPGGLGGDDRRTLADLGPLGGDGAHRAHQPGFEIALDSQRFQVVLGDQQRGQQIGVGGDQGPHHQLAQFLGRHLPPFVDLAIFVGVDPPAGSPQVEPAGLIDLVVGVGVEFAVDLEPIVVVAPLVGLVVAVGVGEAAEHLPGGPEHEVARLAFEQFDLALRPFLAVGRVDVDVGVLRFESRENVLNGDFPFLRPRGQRAGQAQDGNHSPDNSGGTMHGVPLLWTSPKPGGF